ncbi:MAG TPA: hypothetical protein VGM91_08145 [Conexibacter sp.]
MPIISRILIAFAAFLAVIALLGAWLDRQLLNTDDWTKTSVALLREDSIRVPLGNALAQAIADGSRTTTALQEVLPPRLQPLASQAGAFVADAAQRATQRLLDSPRVQQLWESANRVTHHQFVALMEGNGREIAGTGVVLDLRPMASEVAREAGFSGDLLTRLPNPTGRVVLLRENRLDALRKVVHILDTLAWLPGIAAVVLYGLAIWLAPGARRRALVVSGASLAGAGFLALIGRRVGGHELVNAVAGDGPYVTAASDVWRIGTSLLYELATVVIVVGLFAALGAWLAGPARSASWLRARIAPALAAPVAAVLSVTALAYIALIEWGPLSVLRKPIPILLFAAMLLVGVVLLRDQVVKERAVRQDGLRPGPAA